MPSIISVQEGDEPSFSQIQAHVPGIARAEVVRTDHLKAMISGRVPGDFVRCRVRGAVVNDYVLKISIRLGKNGVYGLADVPANIMRRGNDSYPRRIKTAGQRTGVIIPV